MRSSATSESLASEWGDESRSGSELRTVDEVSAAAGTTTRTTRYYASLGLLPPPIRKGRVALYGDTHLARLEMIKALQEHGFTLQAIERYLASQPADATVEDIAVQRAMLTSWTLTGPERLTRRQLDRHAGRRLSDEQLELLEQLGLLRSSDDGRYTPVHGFEVAVRLLDLDIPVEGMRAAGEAMSRHMSALAEELTTVMRDQVIEPWRSEHHSSEEAARFEQTIASLRRLTIDAVVSAFQRSANDVIARSLRRHDPVEVSQSSPDERNGSANA